MNTQQFDALLNEHNVTDPFAKGFYPRVGVHYRLYWMTINVHILWSGAGRYVRTEWLKNVWLPAHCIRFGLEDVVEIKKFTSRSEMWRLVAKDIVWEEPSWLARNPAGEQELLQFALGSWQRSCIAGNNVTFDKLRGEAAHYRLSYQRSFRNLLRRIEAAGYVLEPVYGPRGGEPKTYLVYRS